MFSRKHLYIAGTVIAALLILGLLLQWMVQDYLKPRIGRVLQNVIVKGSDSLYRFAQDDCAVNIWAGSVTIKNCRLSLDSVRYAERRAAGSLPALTVSMHLTEIRVSGFSVWAWLWHRKVDCSNLTLVGSEVSLYRHPGERTKTKGTVDLYTLIRPVVAAIHVKELALADVRISYDNGDSAKPFRWAFERCDLRLKDILIDPSTVSDSARIGYARSLLVDMKQVSLLVSKGLYRLPRGAFYYDFEKRQALLDDLALEPTQDPAAFYAKIAHQQDRYRIHVPEIRMQGLNISELILDNLIKVDSAELVRPVIHISNDRTMPPSGLSKMGRYPQQLLAKAPLDILLRRLHISGGTLTYAEKNAKTKRWGTLSFDRVRGLLTHVTNESRAIAVDPWWTADLRADFLGHSPLEARFSFDLKDPSGRFMLQAHIRDLDAPALDTVTQALAKASVRSFHLDELSVNLTGDERQARADVHMRYDHLTLELLKADSGRVAPKPLLSFLVNHLAVHADNPSGSDAERTALGVTQTRDPYKSFFNLIWKTMFTGIRTIALKRLLRPRQK
jgi:hypothetical protein